MVKTFTCPKCLKPMKSKSGWTLHVKTCCPEQRWRKTTVKMTIEFDIPVALDNNEPYFGTRDAWPRSVPTTSLSIFNMAFGTREVRHIGQSKITSAQLIDQTIHLRTPTQMEINAQKRAQANQNKVQAMSECSRILMGIIGTNHGMGIYQSTKNWPAYVTIRLGDPNLKRWRIAQDAKFTFKFDIQAGIVYVGKGPTKQDNYYNYVHTQTTSVRLADPALFNKIRSFTGLQPLTSYTCAKCGKRMKSKSGFTLHMKTCK